MNRVPPRIHIMGALETEALRSRVSRYVAGRNSRSNGQARRDRASLGSGVRAGRFVNCPDQVIRHRVFGDERLGACTQHLALDVTIVLNG